MISRCGLLLLLAFAFTISMPGHAQAGPEDAAEIDPAVLTEGFLAAHPDLRWRLEGLRAYEREDYADAAKQFRRAARYADKPSQAMLADMYWEGTGVAQDRELGYVWMDLAAERLYPDFILFRERYWSRLDEDERRDAIERGQAIFAEFGDAAAKPRLDRILRRERRNITGSRTGFVGNLTIIPFSGPLAGSGMSLRGDEYYAPKYWDPVLYWQLQDEIWRAPPRERVDVGDLEMVEQPEQ